MTTDRKKERVYITEKQFEGHMKRIGQLGYCSLGADRELLEGLADAAMESREAFLALTDKELNDPKNERAQAVLEIDEMSAAKLMTVLKAYGLNGIVHQGSAFMSSGGRLEIIPKVISVSE